MQVFNDFESKLPPFNIFINGVSHFGERVIFLAIEPNEALLTLQKSLVKEMKINLNLFNAQYKDQAFHPHITLAFRDLKKQYFTEAFSHFESLNIAEKFQSSSISLLKHNGKNWEIFREYDF